MWNRKYSNINDEDLHVHTNITTLDKLTDNGSNLFFNGMQIIGGTGSRTEVAINGRGYALFSLRGGTINIKKNMSDNGCSYSFPPIDTNRGRRLFIWGSGGTQKTIDIPDGVLLENDALVYDITTHTLATVNGTWGNIPLTDDKFLLIYNNLGIIGGILSKYCVYGEDRLSIPVREIEGALISNTGSTQGIFIIGNELFKCAHSNDLHTDFVNIGVVSKTNPNTSIRTISHNLGHLNAPSYSSVKNSLIVGNGAKDYSMLAKGWIIPNFSSVASGTTIDFNTIDKIELDFTQLTGEYKGQLCWGYESTDIVYLFTNDNSILRKVLLGKGSNNLGSGVFVSTTDVNRYNGSYSIQNTWYSRTSDILGGMLFYNGYIYTGVKGENCIRKCIPLTNGYFDTEYVKLVSKVGDMQGLAIDNTDFYAFTDSKGYKFEVSNL